MIRTAVVVAMIVLGSAAVWGADKTDVVVLANGDRTTGEFLQLNRGQLEVKTDDAGTIEFEWEKIRYVESTRLFEITLSDGRRLLGGLQRTVDGSLLVVGAGPPVPVLIAEVTTIVPIGASFWKKLEGSVDAGFSYTRSSGIAQTTINSDTQYRRPAFLVQLTGSGTVTSQSDESKHDSIGSLSFSYVRYRRRLWFVGGGVSLESNESLGLVLRTQASAYAGPRLVNTNRAQVEAGAGLVVNHEQSVDETSTKNVEGLLVLTTSYYAYDHPKTNFDMKVQYFPSLSNWGRQRLQFNTAVKRELWKDFYVGLNMYDTFDSAPSNPDSAHNDVGVTASVGWSFGR